MTKIVASKRRHPLHSMCSYLGSFPPHVPRRLLTAWFRRRRLILDPFCGGGTTLLEAAALGHSTVGLDLNPLAVALSRAKLQQVAEADLIARLTELGRQFDATEDLGLVPSDIVMLFHEKTLQQLAFLRRTLDPSSAEDSFLLGALLGILHGKFRKDGSTAYLSIDMPNTFSMSPQYVRQFVARHRLTRPAVDVFGKLRHRVGWLLRDGGIPTVGRHLVIGADGARASDVLKTIGISAVGGVLTSPPYLGVLRYGAFNWIRLWLLGEEAASVDRRLDATDSLDRYLSFMVSFLTSVARVMRRGSPMALVIGDVEERGRVVPLALRLWQEVEEIVPFRLLDLSIDAFDPDGKTTRIWGEDKKGRATPRDRVLVLARA